LSAATALFTVEGAWVSKNSFRHSNANCFVISAPFINRENDSVVYKNSLL
jgi:hypothetical protein